MAIKNKHLARLVLSASLSGAIIISTAGFGIYQYFKGHPITPNPDGEKETHVTGDLGHGSDPMIDEITTEQGTAVPPTEFDSFVPGVDAGDDIVVEDNFDENMIKSLALLTNATRDYIESITGRTSDVTHTSIDHIISNSDNSVTIYGKGQSGSKIKRIVAKIDNFNLANYSTEPNEFAAQLAEDLEAALLSSSTQYSVKVDTYYKVTNSKVAKQLLQSRLAELKESGASSEEVAYITELLSKPGALELLIVDPVSTKTDNGTYKTSYTVLMSTAKYGYTAQGGFETSYQLRGEDRYAAIENHLASNSTNIELNSAPQTEINQALALINNEAKELQTENALGKQ